MRMDKLTLKAQDAFSSAQNIATEMNHYEIQPEHLLKALVEQDAGIFESISQKIGASTYGLKDEINQVLSSMPRQVGAGPGGGAMSPALRDLLNQAWNEAVNLKDNYLSTEHLILALTREGTGKGEADPRSPRIYQGKHPACSHGHQGKQAR